MKPIAITQLASGGVQVLFLVSDSSSVVRLCGRLKRVVVLLCLVRFGLVYVTLALYRSLRSL